MRYFFHIGYLGTHYCGWQRHLDTPSVQRVLEEALSQVLKTPLWIVGCGRTDAQVHASQFFFHLDTQQTWDYDLQFRLNKLLPDDIAVFDILPMPEMAHARFDAFERSYDYFIHNYKDPFLSKFSSYYATEEWNLELMQNAARLLLQYNDYHAFCKTPGKNLHTICNVIEAGFYVHDSGNRLRFRITANRFLGKMVRIIIGKLIEVGTGKITISGFEHYLVNPNEVQFIKPAHPQGLYLSRIKYPYLDIPPRTHFVAMLAGNEGSWKLL